MASRIKEIWTLLDAELEKDEPDQDLIDLYKHDLFNMGIPITKKRKKRRTNNIASIIDGNKLVQRMYKGGKIK